MITEIFDLKIENILKTFTQLFILKKTTLNNDFNFQHVIFCDSNDRIISIIKIFKSNIQIFKYYLDEKIFIWLL